MGFGTVDEILNELNSVSSKRINRTLYEIITSLDVVGIYDLTDWEKLIIFLLKSPKYQNSQGLSHWFGDLTWSRLQEDDLLFLLPVILDEIDKLNMHIFHEISSALANKISSNELQAFVNKLKTNDSESSASLAKSIEREKVFQESLKE